MENKVEKEGYIGYYFFVLISSIIGFFVLLFSSRALITISAEKGIINLTTSKMVLSILISVIGVIIFVFLSMLFKSFFKKIFFSEIFLYLYMGFLTTAVNIILFNTFLNIFSKSEGAKGLGWKLAELLAFVLALLFAYITNKFFVFKSSNMGISVIGKEFLQFTVGRLFTELINYLMMWIMIDIKKMNELMTKILAAIIVVALNYIFSKFIIFRKKDVQSK